MLHTWWNRKCLQNFSVEILTYIKDLGYVTHLVEQEMHAEF
jgi:hypothetical protein